MNRTALISHPDCLSHEMGAHHPEAPQRLHAINDALHEHQLFDFLQHHEAPRATRQDIERVHDGEYVDWLEQRVPAQGYVHLDMDTAMNAHTLAAAYRAAGAVVLAVDLVMRGQADNAFCNVRPPGHHAERDQALGFCFFNNVAVGAAYALENHALERVLICDFDVHHGNGTEQIFSDDPRVAICSSFQSHLFPDKHYTQHSTRILNAVLEPGTGSQEFRQAVTDLWLPAIERFQPECIFISAGFDAHQDDPLAELNLLDQDYYWVTHELLGQAHKHCGGRLISTLEGGYNLNALGRSAAQHIRALMAIDEPAD